MDLHSYLEPEFEKELNERGSGEPNLKNSAVKDLDDEERKKFVDFTAKNQFVGTFTGEGQEYTFQDNLIHTWAFKDQNGKHWLIPQWEGMNQPEPEREEILNPFKGFQHEEPNKFLYLITYEPGNDHTGEFKIRVFRKEI